MRYFSKESKEKLASQVAHDIRAPLTALNIIVQNTPELPPDKKDLMESALDRMKDIASELLEIKHPNSLPIFEDSIEDLTVLVDLIINEKRYYACDQDIEIQDLSCGRLYVRVNRNKFLRTLSNLLVNAIEASCFQGRIRVRMKRHNKKAILQITDGGCGIPKNILSQLGHCNLSHGKEQGCGIGYSMAKDYIESLGGSIHLQSKEGWGTKVQITLPLFGS